MRKEVVEQMVVRPKECEIFIRKDLENRRFSNCVLLDAYWEDDYFYVEIEAVEQEASFQCAFRFGGNVKVKYSEGRQPIESFQIQKLKYSYRHNLCARQRFYFHFAGKGVGISIKSYAVQIENYKT